MLGAREDRLPFLIILAAVVFGYAQVTFGLGALKWDAIDVVFPFRHYFSECVQAGYFPFWNPYQQTGVPFYADLQAPTYYPELWIVSFFGGYKVMTMHVLMIVYLFLAGWGFYLLVSNHVKDRYAALIGGLAYALSGYMVGHGQHFFLIVGAAWIPFVLRWYWRMTKEGKPADALKASLFTYLLLTGAYQAQSIVVFYLLVGILLYQIIQARKKGNALSFKKLMGVNALYALVTLILCAPLIYATLEVLPLVDRLSEGVDLSRTLDFGQPITGLLSFIAPYATVQYDALFGGVDRALTNHYIGTIPLLFSLLALTKKQKATTYSLVAFGILVFSMSFDFVPVRQFAFDHVPFMDLFLLASYLRLFGLMAIIFLAVQYLSDLDRNLEIDRSKAVLLALLFMGGIAALVWASYAGYIEGSTGYELPGSLVIPAATSISILMLFILLVLKRRVIPNVKVLMVVLVLADLIFAVQWNIGATMVSSENDPRAMDQVLELTPDGFPVPSNGKVIYNDEQHSFFKPFWRNTYIFTKEVSFQSFSSFKLASYSAVDDKWPELGKQATDNHLFYLSDTIVSASEYVNAPERYIKSNMVLVVEDEQAERLSQKLIKRGASDRVELIQLKPNKAEAVVNIEHGQVLTLLQSSYPGWSVFIDGALAEYFTSNFNYKSIYLQPGEHTVKFEYSNDGLLTLYFISGIAFIVLIVVLAGRSIGSTYGRTWARVTQLGMVFFVLFGTLRTLAWPVKTDVSKHEYYLSRYQAESALFNLEKEFEEAARSDTLLPTELGENLFVDSGRELIPLFKIANRDLPEEGDVLFVRFKIWTDLYPSALLVSEINGDWHAIKVGREIQTLNDWNEVQYVRRIAVLTGDDELKVYILNADGDELLINDFNASIHSYK